MAQLPPPGVMTRVATLTSAPMHQLEGMSVRVVGRVVIYDPVGDIAWIQDPKGSQKDAYKSEAERKHTLGSASQEFDLKKVGSAVDENADLNKLLKVDTQLVDSDIFCQGSIVMVIGELEINEVCELSEEMDGMDAIETVLALKARAASCADSLDYNLYLRSLDVLAKLNCE